MMSDAACVKVEKNVSPKFITHMVDLERLFTEVYMKRLEDFYIKL